LNKGLKKDKKHSLIKNKKGLSNDKPFSLVAGTAPIAIGANQ